MQPVKFTFDTEFETAQSRRKAPAAPPPPSYSQADLDAAVAAAAAHARDQGRQDAEAELEAALGAATVRLEQQLADLRAALEANDGRVESEAARLGHAIASRLCETLARRLPLAEIEAMVGAVLQEVRDEPRLAIHVSADLADAARDRFTAAARAAAFTGDVAILPDPAMGPGDCRIEWAHGSALRDATALARAIAGAVDSYVAAREA